MGRYSVKPSTTPRITAWVVVNCFGSSTETAASTGKTRPRKTPQKTNMEMNEYFRSAFIGETVCPFILKPASLSLDKIKEG